MGKFTISMAIFNSYVKLPEGNDFMEKHWEKVDGNILRIQWNIYVGCPLNVRENGVTRH